VDLATELLKTAGLLAPGFIAMKLFYVFGAQRQRAQWEWAAWSVLVALPINWLALQLTPYIVQQSGWASDLADAVVRMSLAVVLAGFAVAIWQYGIKRRDRATTLRRFLTDSAWDDVMDEAVHKGRWLEVITTGNEKEIRFLGWLATAGREDNKAEPWVYLVDVRRNDGPSKGWVPLDKTAGLLIHRDHIERIRVLEAVKEEKNPEVVGSAAAED
jgi:hypothetical protein